MVEGENQINRGMEKKVFESRVKDIAALLAIPQLAPIFTSLEKQPIVLDLFTGTGAGAQAVYDKLEKLGNKPAEITMVDIFLPLDNRFRTDLLGRYKRKYSSGMEETKRNMEKVSRECYVNVCKDDALNYIQSVEIGRDGLQLPFDLITAFSTTQILCSPLRGGEQRILPSIIRTIYENGNIRTIYTFGSVYDKWMNQLNTYLMEEYGQSIWNLYAKPEGAGHPDWDKWILTNKQLDLERFETH